MVWETLAPVIVLVVIIVLLILFFPLIREKHRRDSKGKYPEGHFLGQWMGIGVALGIPIGLAFGNIALGIPIGLALGSLIGSIIETKAKQEGKIRKPTKKELYERKKSLNLLMWFFILGLALFVICIFLYLLFN